MMGRTHALSGLVVGLAVAPALGLSGLAQTVPFVLTTTGFTLLPDLDHPRSLLSRSLGPISQAASHLIRGVSAGLYRITKTAQDTHGAHGHRALTHTSVFALLSGAAAGLVGQAHPWAVALIAAAGAFAGSLALGGWILAVFAGAALTWFAGVEFSTAAAEVALAAVTWKIGFAVAAGVLTHAAGDALTEGGCPLLWPARIRGRSWYGIRAPEPIRFHTGQAGETLLVAPALLVLTVWLAWPYLAPLLTTG